MIIYDLLFPNAKFTEYIRQHFGVGYLSCYFSERSEAVLQVERKQFAGQAVSQTLLHALYRLVGTADRFVVPHIGEHDRGGLHGVASDAYQFAPKRFYLAFLGRYGKKTGFA